MFSPRAQGSNEAPCLFFTSFLRLLFSFSLSHAPWTNSTAKQWCVYVCAFISVTQSTSSKISSCIFDAEAVLKRLMGFQSRQLLKLYFHPQRSQVSLFPLFSCSPTVTFFFCTQASVFSRIRQRSKTAFLPLPVVRPFLSTRRTFCGIFFFLLSLSHSAFFFFCVCVLLQSALQLTKRRAALHHTCNSLSLFFFFSASSNLC